MKSYLIRPEDLEKTETRKYRIIGISLFFTCLLDRMKALRPEFVTVGTGLILGKSATRTNWS
jgi:hypothetical protein